MAESPAVDSFSEDIKALLQIQKTMKDFAAEVKKKRDPIKAKMEEVKSRVMQFMKTQDVDVCNFAEEKIELKISERQNPLNKKTLLQALTSFFGDPERAQTCFDAIMLSLGKKQVEMLRVTKAKKKKTPVKRAKKEHKAQEEDDEEDQHRKELLARGVQEMSDDESESEAEAGEEEEDNADELPPEVGGSSDEE